MGENTRSRVLGAAGPIFAEKGFERATVREICDAAGVNLASVNYHFGDKETLYLETVRRAHQLRVQQVPPAEHAPDAPLAVRLRGFIHTLLSRMTGVNADPWQVRLMMREVLHPTAACQAMAEDYFRPQILELMEVLDEILPVGLSPEARWRYAFSVIGQCLFYRVGKDVTQMLTSDLDRSEFSLDALADHISSFTLAALRVSPSSATSNTASSPEASSR